VEPGEFLTFSERLHCYLKHLIMRNSLWCSEFLWFGTMYSSVFYTVEKQL
jgi:hypothetical protein